MLNIKYTFRSKFCDTYPIINIIFAGIILLVFIYSASFSPDQEKYPLECIHLKYTGKPCETCGLSRSFTEIIHLNFDEARSYNPNGIPIFAFFFFQLFLRLTGLIICLKINRLQKLLILSDIMITVFWFIVAFKNLIFLF